jgi:hypothetical protein
VRCPNLLATGPRHRLSRRAAFAAHVPKMSPRRRCLARDDVRRMRGPGVQPARPRFSPRSFSQLSAYTRASGHCHSAASPSIVSKSRSRESLAFPLVPQRLQLAAQSVNGLRIATQRLASYVRRAARGARSLTSHISRRCRAPLPCVQIRASDRAAVPATPRGSPPRCAAAAVA